MSVLCEGHHGACRHHEKCASNALIVGIHKHLQTRTCIVLREHRSCACKAHHGMLDRDGALAATAAAVVGVLYKVCNCDITYIIINHASNACVVCAAPCS